MGTEDEWADEVEHITRQMDMTEDERTRIERRALKRALAALRDGNTVEGYAILRDLHDYLTANPSAPTMDKPCDD